MLVDMLMPFIQIILSVIVMAVSDKILYWFGVYFFIEGLLRFYFELRFGQGLELMTSKFELTLLGGIFNFLNITSCNGSFLILVSVCALLSNLYIKDIWGTILLLMIYIILYFFGFAATTDESVS